MPGRSVCPAKSGAPNVVGVGIPRSLYAVTRSVCAIDAAVSVICKTPDVVTLALPVKDVPGERPMSPLAVPEFSLCG